MADQLKPCPFCGSKNPEAIQKSLAYVYCSNCGARGPERGDGKVADYIDLQNAIDDWNLRKRGKK